MTRGMCNLGSTWAASDSVGSVVIRMLMVLVAFVILASPGCGQASSPTERQEKRAGVQRGEPASQLQPEPTTSSAGGTPVGEAFAEAELRPVGDSGVSGAVVFKQVGSLGVQVELSASGLPDPGEVYVAQVHRGSCSEVQKGADQEHEEDHGGEHLHGGGGPALALVRLERFLPGGREEYAHHTEYEEPAADELPGNIDSPLSMSASNDGTGAVTSLLEGVEPKQLSSGVPKYMDLRAPNEGAPEKWPALACADLIDGD